MAFNLLGLMTAGAQFGQGYNTGNQQALQAKFLQEKQSALEAYQQGRINNGANANTIKASGQQLTNNKNAAGEYDKFIGTHPDADPATVGDMMDSRFGTNIGATIRGMQSGQSSSGQPSPAAGPPTSIPAVPGATPPGQRFGANGQTVNSDGSPQAAPPATNNNSANTAVGMFGPTDRSQIAAGNQQARIQVGAGNNQTSLANNQNTNGVRLQLGTVANGINQQRANDYGQSVDNQIPVANINAGARVGAARIQANGAVQVGAGHDAANRADTQLNDQTRITTTGMNNRTAITVGAGHDDAADYRTDATTQIQQSAQQLKQYNTDPYLKDIQARLNFAANEVKRGQGIVQNADNQKNGAAKSGNIAGDDRLNLDNSEDVNITNGQSVVQRNLAEAQRLQAAAQSYIQKKYGGGGNGGTNTSGSRFTAPQQNSSAQPAIKQVSTADLIRAYQQRGLGRR